MTQSLQKNLASGFLISAGLFMLLNVAFGWGFDTAAWLLFSAGMFSFAYCRIKGI